MQAAFLVVFFVLGMPYITGYNDNYRRL